MKIYLASSWRNPEQPALVRLLREAGHDVYDFRNPPDRSGFGWEQLARGESTTWTPLEFREALDHPVAWAGFASDMRALCSCDACLLALPCNRSAHLELGWACAAGKETAVYMPYRAEPELMYHMVDRILISEAEIREWLHDAALVVTA